MAVRVIVVNLARISGNKTHYYRIMLVTSNAVVGGSQYCAGGPRFAEQRSANPDEDKFFLPLFIDGYRRCGD